LPEDVPPLVLPETPLVPPLPASSSSLSKAVPPQQISGAAPTTASKRCRQGSSFVRMILK